MSDVGRWLAGARAADGGLLLPGVPTSRACDLLLTAGRVLVRADDEVAELSWADVADRPDTLTNEGVAPNRLSGDSLYDQQYVGLQQGLGMRQGLHVDTLRVLCSLLRDREDWRARPDDPARVQRLAADLTARQHLVVSSHSVRRSTLLVLNALRALGHEHEIGGRPLPGWRAPNPDQLVSDVLAHVRSDPYATGAHVEANDVRAVVERYYTDVETGPFAALVN